MHAGIAPSTPGHRELLEISVRTPIGGNTIGVNLETISKIPLLKKGELRRPKIRSATKIRRLIITRPKIRAKIMANHKPEKILVLTLIMEIPPVIISLVAKINPPIKTEVSKTSTVETETRTSLGRTN